MSCENSETALELRCNGIVCDSSSQCASNYCSSDLVCKNPSGGSDDTEIVEVLGIVGALLVVLILLYVVCKCCSRKSKWCARNNQELHSTAVNVEMVPDEGDVPSQNEKVEVKPKA